MSSWETTEHDLSGTLAPWDRQPGESSRMYVMFCHYRDAGPARSTQMVRDLGYGFSESTPRRHEWVNRATAWDDYQERIRRNEIIKETREMAQRQAEEAKTMQQALMAPVRALEKKLAADTETTMEELESLPVAKLVDKIQASARVLQPMMNAERLARGLPTEITEGRQEHVHSIDAGDADRIAGILDALRETPALLAHVLGAGKPGEVVDAEVVEMGADRPPPETDDIPVSATA